MIKKIIISFIIILFVYIIIVHNVSVHFPKWKGGFQNQWQDNIIKAQEFAYGNYTGKTVIVGSSLACRITIPENSTDFYNLSFAGGSPFDGLGVIKKSGVLPSYIFIETNYYTRSSGEIQTTVFAPIPYRVKRFIAAFQEKYQPTNVLIAILEKYQPMNIMLSIMQGTKKKVLNIFSDDAKKKSKTAVNVAKPPSQPLNKERLDIAMRNCTVVPAPETIKESLEQLSMYIHYFERYNVKVVFFEMPIDGSLYNAPYAVVLRSKLHERFPPTSYTYLKEPVCQDYETSEDGIHLMYESSLVYSHRFLNEVESIIEQ